MSGRYVSRKKNARHISGVPGAVAYLFETRRFRIRSGRSLGHEKYRKSNLIKAEGQYLNLSPPACTRMPSETEHQTVPQ